MCRLVDGWLGGWIDGRKEGRMDGWLDGWMVGWLEECPKYALFCFREKQKASAMTTH